jgi:hypothetical protein
MPPCWYLAPASRVDSRRRTAQHAGQATWPWSHVAQMQTSRSQRTQRKRRTFCSIAAPAPVTFLDTGTASSDGPPRSVASISAMTQKARGGYPGPSPCQRSPRATRLRQPVQESGATRLGSADARGAGGLEPRPSRHMLARGAPPTAPEGSGLRPDLVAPVENGPEAVASTIDSKSSSMSIQSGAERAGPVPGDLGESGTLLGRR